MNLARLSLPLVASLALLAVACGDKTTIVSSEGSTPVGVSSSGVGTAVGEPDVVILRVGVQAERATVEEAREAAAVAQRKVIDSLKGSGVADRDIQTVQFAVNPVYDFRGNSQQIRGYQVSNVVSAKIRRLENAGGAVDAAVRAGGNDAVVQSLSFTIDDPTRLRAQAREQAVQRARDQAEQLARAAGARLGQILSITEESPSTPEFQRSMSAPATGAFQTDTPIEGGELEIRVSVKLLYALE
jgi:uncharacterized protein